MPLCKNPPYLYAVIIAFALNFSACANGSSFQEQVKDDVKEIKQYIKATHPAFLEPEENKAFIAWWQTGDKLVEEKLPLVTNHHKANALLKYYLLGYKEPHMSAGKYLKCKLCLRIPFTRINLVKQEDAETDLSHFRWSGFFVDLVKDEFVVGHTSQNWPIDLPPSGAKLLSCDQQVAKDIYFKQILPYKDQRTEIDTSAATALFTLSAPGKHPLLNQQLYTSCGFLLADGSQTDFPLKWLGLVEHKERKDDDWHNIGKKFNKGKKTKLGIKKISDLTWVKLPSFSVPNKKIASFNTVLKHVQQLNDDNQLVIDLRGNRGGSLFYMSQLIQSIYPSIDSMWHTGKAEPKIVLRKSNELRQFYEYIINKSEKSEQDSISPKQRHEINSISMLLQLLNNHKNAEEALTITKQQQPELFQITHKDNIRQQDFGGQVIVLTGHDCFSACLTFVDLLRTKQQVTHVGKTTDADTKYVNNITLSTSNRKRFSLPLMHLSTRVRADNQPIEPHYEYTGYIWDTAAVAAWVGKIAKSL